MSDVRLSLVEFPADDPERALRFWAEILGQPLSERGEGQGEGWQAASVGETGTRFAAVGVHARGPGPGDSHSLPYFAVAEMAQVLERVEVLGGQVVHPGERWAVCRDSEGNPFGLVLDEGTADRTAGG